MNGGFFPPHINHRQGDIADGSYPGYSNRDGSAATAMLAHLAPVADRTLRVFVAYRQTEGNAFWREIRDKRPPLRG